MSQYGALALGNAGTSYESILEHYYGLRPQDGSATLPETVRVGLLVEQPEVRVLADGPFSLVSEEYGVVPVRAGEWTIRRAGEGLIILAPEGAVYDSPLLRLQRFHPR